MQTTATIQQLAEERVFPAFNLARLLTTVFDPEPGDRVAILIDLDDLSQIKDFAFLKDPRLTIQAHAYHDFYLPLKETILDQLQLQGGGFFAYEETGGSNLDMKDRAMAPDGGELSLKKDIYPHYDIILCISTYSATAPLTAQAKKHGFRGATLHGVNEVILSSGLAVDYNEVSREAEKMRLGMTGADEIEVDFEVEGKLMTLKLILGGQEAQKSHGLCRGREPDVANLPAGEIYYVPEDAEGEFPMQYEDGTLGIMKVKGGRIVEAVLCKGDQAVIDRHNEKLRGDPVTGELGELGFGTQILPVSGRDIQDEKVLGTMHVATGRSDHLGGHLTPDRFAEASNATHDDILFSPDKTPAILVTQVRMRRNGSEEVLLENFQPASYLRELLSS